MSEAEDWAVIVRAKNQEIQKWQQQALELSNLVAPLRDEVARLKERMQQAYYDRSSCPYCLGTGAITPHDQEAG